MTWSVEFSPAARAAPRTLHPQMQERIVRRLEGLARDPRESSNVKPVIGGDSYRLRIGDCRVIYTLIDEELLVFVVRVGHRREIYR